MKILGLCFLLSVCLAPISQAQKWPNQDTPNLTKTDQVPQNSLSTGHLSFFEHSQSTPHLRLHRVDPDALSEMFSEPFCAYMRTYRVKREYRNSDVVSPAGYTTCVPSTRFEVRSAVQVQSEPAERTPRE